MVEVVNGMNVKGDSRVSLPRLAAEARFETASNSARPRPRLRQLGLLATVDLPHAVLVCSGHCNSAVRGTGPSGKDYCVVCGMW